MSGEEGEKNNPFFLKKIEPIEVGEKKISDLLADMTKTGFQGKKLGEAVDVWMEMIKEKGLTIFLGYAGSLSTTGQWKIINWLIENRFVDVVVSTGANISEDILDAMGHGYWQGSHQVDDAKLLEYKIDRFYDVYADELKYREMESLIANFMREVNPDYNYSSAEFLHLLGKKLSEMKFKSITATAFENKIPIFSPAIVDSGYGIAYMLNKKLSGNHFKISIDQMKDFEQIVEIKSRSENSGVIYIGGGVPKDFIQLTTVARSLTESRKYERIYPHKYAIQITTDSPQWGGLSGCTFEEAISWGKEDPRGKNVVCYCDATIALPIIVHALNEKMTKKPRNYRPDMSWIFKDIEK